MSSDEIDKIIEKAQKGPDGTPLLLPLLYSVQEHFSYISKNTAHEIARKTGIPFSRIYGVITFYDMLYTEPKGKYIIRICNGPSCYLNHSLTLIKFLESFLKIKSGQTTKDKKFSLEIVSCIGCCDKAPAMMINDEVYGNLNEHKIKKIISRLR